jgi:hypothetical protein
VCASGAVQLQYNWGFEFVRLFWQLPENSAQWLGALILVNAFISPIASGIIFGYLRSLWKGAFYWIVFGALVPCWFYLFCILIETKGDFSYFQYPLEQFVAPALCVGLSIGLFYTFNAFGNWIYSQLCRRTRSVHVLTPGIIAIVLLAIFRLATSGLHEERWLWIVQCAADFAVLSLACFYAAFRCGKHSKIAAALCSIFCALPFFIFDWTNVLFTLSPAEETCNGLVAAFNTESKDWPLDEDLVRAQLSALSIFVLHIVASTVGGCIGYWRGQRRLY